MATVRNGQILYSENSSLVFVQVGGLFQEHSSAVSTGELCVKLTLLLEKEGGSSNGTKCTKKLYTSIVKHIDSVSMLILIYISIDVYTIISGYIFVFSRV